MCEVQIRMIKILIVCLGNICRSPMAEGLMRQYLAKSSMEILIDSAGTSSWEKGNPPHPGTQKILKAQGIDTRSMLSRPITLEDFDTYDWILAMDRQNLNDLQQMAPKGTKGKICLFLSVLPEGSLVDVPDPWFTGNFNQTYSLIMQALPKWQKVFEQ